MQNIDVEDKVYKCSPKKKKNERWEERKEMIDVKIGV